LKPFVKVDRCRNHRRSFRLHGLDQPTGYGNRKLHIGLSARLGRLRFRAYLLGKSRNLTVQEWADEVLPGRIEAVTAELNERFAGVLPDGMRFEWGPAANRSAD